MSQLPNVRGIIQKTGKPHINSARRKAKESARGMKRRGGIRAEARTDAEIDHIMRVKALPCALTGKAAPSHAHHILTGRTPGRKVSDWLILPLSDEAHTGQGGIHGDQSLWRLYNKNELDCLADTLKTLYG